MATVSNPDNLKRLALAYCDGRHLASATTEAIMSLCRRWGDLKVTTANVSAFLDSRRKSVRASSYNRELATLRGLLNYGNSHGLCSVILKAKTEKETRNPVLFLTLSDIEKIRVAELPEELEAERDRFLLQCATGLRASDIARLKAEQLHGGVLTLRLQKTEEVITIPLSGSNQALFARVLASGTARNNQRVPAIREICRLAGLDEPWTRASRINGELVEEHGRRWQFVGTHTARRSFICNLLSKGVSIEVIMSMTGHQSYDSIKPYIGISDDTKSHALALLD